MGLFTLISILMKKIAISACLLGEKCRYDASDNRDEVLLEQIKEYELIAFCPEDDAFGSPRPTIDLIETTHGIKAISNKTGKDLSFAIEEYAKVFFDTYADITMFIGKDRSPSCGVCTAKLYNEEKELLSEQETGIMAKEAKLRGIKAVDAENIKGKK